MKRFKNLFRRVLCLLLCLFILGITSVSVINMAVKLKTEARILSSEAAAQLENVDCILVLGCYVFENGNPSAMLRDRLTRSVELYELDAAPKLLMSGDHGRYTYNEVDAMKRFSVDAGVPTEDIFMDHAGFSTYESVYRAKEVFAAKKIIIVTQEYHLYRALYIARQLGIEAYGVASDYHTYAGQIVRDIREILARVKDVGSCLFKVKPTFLGDVIPISGNGNLTNDEFSDFY